MTIKVEHLKSKEQFDEMTAFLLATLDDTYTIHSPTLHAMWQTQFAYFIVARDENNVITGLQFWLTPHDPMHGAKRLCMLRASYGVTTGFESARDTAFSMFEHGWELI